MFKPLVKCEMGKRKSVECTKKLACNALEGPNHGLIKLSVNNCCFFQRTMKKLPRLAERFKFSLESTTVSIADLDGRTSSRQSLCSRYMVMVLFAK